MATVSISMSCIMCTPLPSASMKRYNIRAKVLGFTDNEKSSFDKRITISVDRMSFVN